MEEHAHAHGHAHKQHDTINAVKHIQLQEEEEHVDILPSTQSSLQFHSSLHELSSSPPASSLSHLAPNKKTNFTKSELWQLRKAFDIFASKYRTNSTCFASRDSTVFSKSSDSLTSSMTSTGASTPSLASPSSTTHEDEELEEAAGSYSSSTGSSNLGSSAGTPTVMDDYDLPNNKNGSIKVREAVQAANNTVVSSAPTSPAPPQHEKAVSSPVPLSGTHAALATPSICSTLSPSHLHSALTSAPRALTFSVPEHEDMITMEDFAYCFASWTGISCCETSMNMHLFMSCSLVQQLIHDGVPTLTFDQFVSGFHHYVFGAAEPGVCQQQEVRRKRLFRSLTQEVFESLKGTKPPRFSFFLFLIELSNFLFPPVMLLRHFLSIGPSIRPLPPFKNLYFYTAAMSILWLTCSLLPLIISRVNSDYEGYTTNNKLCEIETLGLFSLYWYLALYYSLLIGSHYDKMGWEKRLKRDLDWLEIMHVRSPLNCATRMRNAKDIFQRIFLKIYIESSQSDNQTLNKKQFRKVKLSKMRRTLLLNIISFCMAFPVAFLPTLYRSAIAQVDVLPTGEDSAMFLVFNWMFSSIALAFLLIYLNILMYQNYLDFSATLRAFNCIHVLHRAQLKLVPYVPLNNPENVRSWSMMRRYLLEIHMHQKLSVLENNHGILLLTVIAGIIWVVIRALLTNHTYASSLLVMYVTFIFALQLLCVIFASVNINDSQNEHVRLLCDQSWNISRVLLSFPHMCNGDEKIRLTKTEALLKTLTNTIKNSHTILRVWGVPMTSNFRNALVTVLFSAITSATGYWMRNLS